MTNHDSISSSEDKPSPLVTITLDLARYPVEQIPYLTATWHPDRLTPAAQPVLDRLTHTLRTSGHDAISGTEAQPPDGPAFRINCNDLNFGDVFVDVTPDEKAAETYRYLKELTAWITSHIRTAPDPRVRFDDDTRTIEIDDWEALLLSGLRTQLSALARCANVAKPRDHPGAPAAGTRAYSAAVDGVDLRAIEHAFGVEGHRPQRQTERRNLNAGLTSAAIADVYQQYDKALSPRTLKDIKRAVDAAARTGGLADAFRKMFQHGGFALGENHSSSDTLNYVNAHMKE